MANRRLSEYYGDRGQGYTSAREVAAAFGDILQELPRFFRRSEIAERLRLRHDRELALLSDALSVLATKGLIKFSPENNQWENLNAS